MPHYFRWQTQRDTNKLDHARFSLSWHDNPCALLQFFLVHKKISS